MAEENQQGSLRDALEASFDSAAAEPVETSSSEPVAAESTPTETTSSETTQEYKAPEEPAAEPKKDYDRDEKGKFAEPEKAVKKEGITPGPKAGQPKEERAPQAWKPEAREFWSQIPEAARKEILRNEQHIQQTLRDTAEERRLAQAFKETVRPFEHFIKAEGSNPIQALDNLMSTAARFRTGNATDVANLVTELINNFGVGRFGNTFIQTLDATLSGMAPQQQIDPYVQQMEQRVRQMEGMFQQQQFQQTQQVEQMAQSEVSDFLSQAEFGHDLREDMADIIDMAAARGQNLSLQEAYDRACWANPEIRNILAERQNRERAQQTNQVAQTARRAAVSVGGSPAFNPNQEAGTSIRDAIEFAMRR